MGPLDKRPGLKQGRVRAIWKDIQHDNQGKVAVNYGVRQYGRVHNGRKAVVMARKSNSQGNRIVGGSANLASSQFATRYNPDPTKDDARRVSDALEREAEFQTAINNYEMARFLCDVSEGLGEAGLARICKDIKHG